MNRAIDINENRKSSPIVTDIPMLSDVSKLLWSDPRQEIETLCPSSSETDPFDYIIGMAQEETAFLCGLLREKRPAKLLEVGVNKGGTTAVILKALDMLQAKARLISVDINPDVYAKELLNRFPTLTDRWELKCGRDVSAYLEEIGSDIDFCILDTAHYLPGEVLNFLCILPYLKIGATVIIHDQMVHFSTHHPFIQQCGSSATVACRVLFDTVVGEKLVPSLKQDNGLKAPNIAAFTVTEDTRKYIHHILSSLMLPWRHLPSREYLSDVVRSLKRNYPQHYVDYFIEVVQHQTTYHLNSKELKGEYWISMLQNLKSKYGCDRVAFYGAGGFCKKLIKGTLPSSLRPSMIFDKNVQYKYVQTIPVHNANQMSSFKSLISVIVITSNAHHEEIQKQLLERNDIYWEIINPFVASVSSY
jgi:predicted O-methyltransferase YrrM